MTEDSSDAHQAAQPCWAELVDKIRQNDNTGLEELYRVFSRGVRFYLCRQLGPQDLDDKVHDTFLTVAQAIQRGDLREPERLMGYVRTIVRRQVAAQIEENVQNRKHQIDLDWGLAVSDAASNPEQTAIQAQNHEIAQKVLKKHRAPRPRDPGPVLPSGADRRTDLRGNGTYRNAVPAAEVSRQSAFRRIGKAPGSKTASTFG